MAADGPVLLCYDGSPFARAAIAEAGRQLAPGRRALVVTVWQPLESIPFYGAPLAPVGPDVDQGLTAEAEETAREGLELAREARFDAEAAIERGAPTWRSIVEVADDRDASLIVIGSHGRHGIEYALMGSVATAVAHHSKRPVLIVRE